jgi:hypothetical protein
MTTKTTFPPLFATNDNYSSGPDTGTPTKVDPATPGNGFVAGTAIAPQHVNFMFNGFNRAARLALRVGATVLRSLNLLGGAITDTSNAVAGVYVGSGRVLLCKAGSDGSNTVDDGANFTLPATAVSSITSAMRRIANSGSRLVAVGAGGVFNATSTNSGTSWSAGGSTGLASALTDCVWDGTDFVGTSDPGGSVHSTNAAAWTAATLGQDVSDILTGGAGSGLAVLTAGSVFQCGNIAGHPHFAKSTTHGLTWSDPGTSGITPADYSNAGWLAGIGAGELYWLGHDSAHTSNKLALFTTANGTTWTKRADVGMQADGVTGDLTLGSNQPKLLMCPDTGLLVAIVKEATGPFAITASLDRGYSWTPPVRATMASPHAFTLARGRLFATLTEGSVALFATDGIGLD